LVVVVEEVVMCVREYLLIIWAMGGNSTAPTTPKNVLLPCGAKHGLSWRESSFQRQLIDWMTILPHRVRWFPHSAVVRQEEALGFLICPILMEKL
jgi:hypothetical protein